MKEWLKLQFELWIERRESRRLREYVCQSCENLKMELARRAELINKLLEKPEPIIQEQIAPQITRPRAIPWRVKQQELEKADRECARELLKDKSKEIKTTEQLEKEVIGGNNAIN